MDDQSNNNEGISLENTIEALLFVSTFRVSPNQLAEALDRSLKDIEEALINLSNRYEQGSGLRLQWHTGRVQLITSPDVATAIERFLGLEVTSKLSRAALETLSVIAYRQPITRPAIDAIRGVNSDGVIRTLLSKGLIEEQGRSEGPGRAIIYGTTEDFLQYFGLLSIRDLPPLEEEPVNGNTNVLKD